MNLEHAWNDCFHAFHNCVSKDYVQIVDGIMMLCLILLQTFTLVLAICLSIGSPKPSAVFSVSQPPLTCSFMRIRCYAK